MKAMRLLALFLVVLLLFTGCGKADDNAYAPNLKESVAVGDGIYESGKENGTSAEVETNRKLIRTITMEAETSDLNVILADLDAKLAELGGYVQNKSVQNGKNGARSYATLTLRIPAKNLDQFVDHVEGATNILSSTEKAEDVTLSYSATVSRITALETEEARLLELLAEAGNLNEILTLESKLADVREELETVKSQLKLYDSLIDYGTLKLTVTEVQEFTVVEDEPEPTAWERIGNGFVKSLKGVWNILTEIFIFLIVALPYLVLVGVIAFVIIFITRRRRKKKQPKYTPNPVPPSQDQGPYV